MWRSLAFYFTDSTPLWARRRGLSLGLRQAGPMKGNPFTQSNLRAAMSTSAVRSTRPTPSTLSDSRAVRIALIAGDGSGSALVTSARKVLESAPLLDIELEFVELAAGFVEFERTGSTVPEETFQELRKCHGAIFGAVCSPRHHIDGYLSPIVALRQQLGLHTNLRPLRNAAGRLDALIVRENTEDLYVGEERMDEERGLAIAERHITRQATSRTARVAMEQAVQRALARQEAADMRLSTGSVDDAATSVAAASRQAHVTCVHKANILGISDGLWLGTCQAMARRSPFAKSVVFEEQLVDIALHDLVLHPEQFDVILAPNLYGDLLQDCGAALCGGLGVVPTANVGDDMFMLAHGSLVVAPSLNDSDPFANPTGVILSSAMLLGAIGETWAQTCIEQGVISVLGSDHAPKTPDMGGSATGKEMRQAIIQAISQFHSQELLSQGS